MLAEHELCGPRPPPCSQSLMRLGSPFPVFTPPGLKWVPRIHQQEKCPDQPGITAALQNEASPICHSASIPLPTQPDSLHTPFLSPTTPNTGLCSLVATYLIRVHLGLEFSRQSLASFLSQDRPWLSPLASTVLITYLWSCILSCCPIRTRGSPKTGLSPHRWSRPCSLDSMASQDGTSPSVAPTNPILHSQPREGGEGE